jgi:hypothetical protein
MGVRTLAFLGALLVLAGTAQAAARLSPAEKRVIDATLQRFVVSAVQRHDLAASYDLVTPALRTGISRAAWTRGQTRVMAYPAKTPRPYGWTLDFAERNDVMVDLLLQPRRRARVGPMIFTIELKRLHGRWLVDSFTPSASFAGSGRTGSMKAFGDYGPNAVRNAKPRHVNRLLLVVPAAVLLLILGVPGAILLRGWRRNRRAERAYGGQVPKGLPPLPPRP